MLDFYTIKERYNNKGLIEIYPDYKVMRSKDLMIRGKSFYAIWDEEKEIWSTDEYDVQRLIDKDLIDYVKSKNLKNASIKLVSDFSSKSWMDFQRYISNISDNSKLLDNNIFFLNDKTTKKDYITKRLPYNNEETSIDGYEELMSTLYEPEERDKIEWAIGSIFIGDSKDIQKFIVLYGEAGTGKSTVLNIIQKLFQGYYTTFDAKALASNNNNFSTEVFKNNPLVAIQHDGDLSKIEDNSKLNSIISHEEMTMNEKYKSSYSGRTNCFLFMGTNKAVKISDSKSGIIRRLIDVRPTGNKIPVKHYQTLITQINFELGGIAKHCINKYLELGKNYYSNYKPLDMMYQTDIFFNFVENNYFLFKEQNGVSLSQAYELYKQYCLESLIDLKLPRHKFREELKSYFKIFEEVTRIDNKQVRSYYKEFLKSKFKNSKYVEEKNSLISLENIDSHFDKIAKEYKAQYANKNETPTEKWDEVTTHLKDIDSSQLHYVLINNENHIVVDFDLKDKKGNKSFELNLAEATKWPKTYCEVSKSGKGIHLHYIYSGDVHRLKNVYSEGIEIKTFFGNASLRRKKTLCNNLEISTISSGLPMKGEKVLDFKSNLNEKAIRTLIENNLKKEYHPSTKSSMDFIQKILEDALAKNIKFDIRDLRPKILEFAINSTNQSDYCIKLLNKMIFSSEETSEWMNNYEDESLYFFDVEVYPNLFVVCYKKRGGKKVKLINPSISDIEFLIRKKIIGYNCRRYDNHILYAKYLGYSNYELFQLSQKIINNSRNGLFSEAYNISYTDVYDFSSEKKSLKKWEIELGIQHVELELPWDQPVPENLWGVVADYCGVDVDATEVVFDYRYSDFLARMLLSELSGLSPNDTTQSHAAKILFGNEKTPQQDFVYTDLGELFPGYKFDAGVSYYRGEEVGEGGYNYAIPGMYVDVLVLDIESMHPTSLIELNAFGKYTGRFKELKDSRVAIKHKNIELAGTLLNGMLKPYLIESRLEELAYALKIVINIVYGLTSAKFDNKFKDPRNKDNIVAKRGALFMIELKNELLNKGITPIHIKTDSVKIEKPTQETINFIINFGKKYGYNFVVEDRFEKFALVNDSVYVAKYAKEGNKWVAVGAEFQHPYIFKSLFSKEKIAIEDLKEVRAVSTSLYLDFNENNEEEHDYCFIGKVGSFLPIKKNQGGALLLRKKEDKYYAVTKSKGTRWMLYDKVKKSKLYNIIDMEYYYSLVDNAIKTLSAFGDPEIFIGEQVRLTVPPWESPCGKEIPCYECKDFKDNECSKQYTI